METYDDIIRSRREFTRVFDTHPEFESDQQKRLPQPPLTKAPVSDMRIKLPMDFKALELNNDIFSVILGRESHRVFTGETMSLLQLSFLLWATQGIKSIRGNNYATLRTVPSGGARHEFETYLIVRDVEGLEPGAYHYLPMTGEIEFLRAVENIEQQISDSLMEQNWAAKANVVFYWAMVPYRCEWRYGVDAHRVALIDAGHVCQNLYISCEAAGLGTCGIAACDYEMSGRIFGLNADEEYVVYTAPVGKISKTDRQAEKDFYAFVADEPGAQG